MLTKYCLCALFILVHWCVWCLVHMHVQHKCFKRFARNFTSKHSVWWHSKDNLQTCACILMPCYHHHIMSRRECNYTTWKIKAAMWASVVERLCWTCVRDTTLYHYIFKSRKISWSQNAIIEHAKYHLIKTSLFQVISS